MNVYAKNLRNWGDIKNLRYYDGKIFTIDNAQRLEIRSTADGRLIDHPFGKYLIDDIDIDRSGNLYLTASENGSRGTYVIIKADINSDFDIVFSKSIKNDIFFVDYNDDEDMIYLASYKYIDQYDARGRLIKTLLTFGKDTSFILDRGGDGNENLIGFAVDGFGNMYIVTGGWGGTLESHIYKFTKTAGEKPEIQKDYKLTITASFKEDFFYEAVNNYLVSHKNVEIIWDVLYNSEEDFYNNRDSASLKLATKIMTNDVGDIIATGGMGLLYYDVFQTDAFIDLSDYIKNDKNYENLNKSILNGITINGKIKGLPVGINYLSLIYNKELGDELGFHFDANTTKWSNLLTVAQKLYADGSSTSLFHVNNPDVQMLFVPFLNANMPQLINLQNKTVDLRQDWFFELLSAFKTVYKQGNLFKYIHDWEEYRLNKDNDYLFKLGYIRGQYDTEVYAYEASETNIQFLPHFNGEKSRNAIAYPISMYSISNNSVNKENAWNLLSFLIEEKTQSIYSLRASPINVIVEKNIRNTSYADMPEAMSQQFDEIESRIDYLYDMSYYKQDIADPVLEYFNDTITLDKAIEKAEYNVWLRLNE